MKKTEPLKILFIGDIVGRPGRNVVAHFIPIIKAEEDIDLVVANAENAAAGFGLTIEKYEELIDSGVDYLTSGNHIFNKAEFLPALNDPKVKLIRPANYPESVPGRGLAELNVRGVKIVLINLIGRVFMNDAVLDPFIVGKSLIEESDDGIILIDFHAEATSEKIALGYYLDGLASAVLCTHTHVQTADEKILPKGTAFISDIGMCGPYDSVIGMKKEIIIEKFLTQLPKSHKVASGESIFNAVLVSIDTETKKAISIKRINRTDQPLH